MPAIKDRLSGGTTVVVFPNAGTPRVDFRVHVPPAWLYGSVMVTLWYSGETASQDFDVTLSWATIALEGDLTPTYTAHNEVLTGVSVAEELLSVVLDEVIPVDASHQVIDFFLERNSAAAGDGTGSMYLVDVGLQHFPQKQGG